MKRILSIILILVLLAAIPLQAGAAQVSVYDAAENLAALGLLRGTENGLELDRAATRAEAVVMLLRLLGREAEAQAEEGVCPFDDGGWASSQLRYAWRNDLVKGRSASHFGSADDVASRDYVTMLLRALGYSDAPGGDFTWRESLSFADSIGLCHGEYKADGAFLRGDMALLSYTALSLRVKDTGITLAEKLYREGVLSGTALRATRLSGAVQTEKQAYDAVEIHERFASAVFLVEMYEDADALQKDKASAHGSGFFLTADGVAAMCYHEIDAREYARIITLDGHRYDVTGVLGYDALWDIAVVRVSRTDLNGETVQSFPYLDLGDSDAIRAGEKVFTLSSALGLSDNITDGIVSNCSREVDDPDFPSIQITAPISRGSSGGALMNCYGEVIGILYGAFSNSENMNLAVPINEIAAFALTGEGTAIREVKRIEDEKKASATLHVSQTEMTLNYGDEVEVLITHDAPCSTNIRYKIDIYGVVECEWGEFTSKHSVPLTIRAISDGEAEITISFAEDGYSEESSVVIYVTVQGTPDETEADLPSGTTDS